MTDDQKPLVIRAKDGTEIDLSEARTRIEMALDTVDPNGVLQSIVVTALENAEAILAALVAALSVPRRGAAQTIEMSDYRDGWNEHDDAVSKAAGVVE